MSEESKDSKIKSVSALFLEQIEDETAPISSAAVASAFAAKLSEFELDTVNIENVEVSPDGVILVEFEDDEGDEVSASFGVDDEGAFALISQDEEEENAIVVDLSLFDVPTIAGTFGTYINLTDLSWLTKDVLVSILAVGMVGPDDMFRGEETPEMPEDNETVSSLSMKEDFKSLKASIAKKVKKGYKYLGTKFAVRGGKKVKVAIFKSMRKHILSAAKKMALVKARMKARTGSAIRTRMRSVQKGKRMGLYKHA